MAAFHPGIMSEIFRSHLPYSRAHILAGALSSAGISAAVGGDNSAHLYGGIPMLDCTIMVPEDQVEEAEAFLKAEVGDEPPEANIPGETCPPNADLPGIGAVFLGGLCCAPFAAVIPALLAGLRSLANHPTSLEPVVKAMGSAYLASLLLIVASLPVVAIGAGLLLRIVQGYRDGSVISRTMVRVIIWLLILCV